MWPKNPGVTICDLQILQVVTVSPFMVLRDKRAAVLMETQFRRTAMAEQV